MSRFLEERRCNLVLKIRAKTDKSFNQRNERWYETISFVERVSNGLCFCLHWLYLLPSHLNSSLFLFIFAFLEMLEKKVIAKTFKVSRHEAAFWNKVKTHREKWSAPLLDFLFFLRVHWHRTNFRSAGSLSKIFYKQSDARIEPGSAGWEAWTLPLCFAVPPPQYLTTCSRFSSTS